MKSALTHVTHNILGAFVRRHWCLTKHPKMEMKRGIETVLYIYEKEGKLKKSGFGVWAKRRKNSKFWAKEGPEKNSILLDGS